MIRRWLVEKLVLEFHLNVEERELLGSSCVYLAEVKQIIREEIDRKGVFPRDAKPSIIGEPAYEGYFIEKTDSLFKLHYNECSPFGILRRHLVSTFESFDQVADEYLAKELHFNIDGIKVIKDKC